jgi:alcohol dehydrogenase class IV
MKTSAVTFDMQLVQLVSIEKEKISKEMSAGGNEVLQWNSLRTQLRNSHNEHMKEEMHQADTVTAICCVHKWQHPEHTQHKPWSHL